MASEVDAAFFQDLQHRPKPTIVEVASIPLIDLSPLQYVEPSDDSAPQALRDLLGEVEAACRDWGFFQVINHGVPQDLLRGAFEASRNFFHLPLVEKRKVRRDEENPLGYYDSEHTKNVRDWKEVFDFTPEDSVLSCGKRNTLRNNWPTYPPELREASLKYASGVEKLAFKLLELISLTMNLPAKRLNAHFDEQLSFLRLNYYPPCHVPHLALGVGRHKDSGALTVLAQDDVGGLDVKRKFDDEWVRVKPIPNSFIINVGDIIQVWSNDKYESVEHRVSVNIEKERLSIPFFFNPGPAVMVKPLDEVTSEKKPSLYKEYNWGDFFSARKTSNFKKLNVENVQVYHFRK